MNDGQKEELAFWDGFLRGEPPNYPNFADWKMTDVGNRTCEWVHHMPDKPIVRAIDIGSGPLLRWGEFLRNKSHRVSWTCVDALMQQYSFLCDKHGRRSRAAVSLGMRTDELPGAYSDQPFDFAIASNSLDHSEDPIGDLKAIAAVTLGRIVVTGFIDEGTQASGQGLHQWDLDAREVGLKVKRFGSKHDETVTDIAGRGIVLSERVEGRRPSFIVVFKGEKE